MVLDKLRTFEQTLPDDNNFFATRWPSVETFATQLRMITLIMYKKKYRGRRWFSSCKYLLRFLISFLLYVFRSSTDPRCTREAINTANASFPRTHSLHFRRYRTLIDKLLDRRFLCDSWIHLFRQTLAEKWKSNEIIFYFLNIAIPKYVCVFPTFRFFSTIDFDNKIWQYNRWSSDLNRFR